MNIKSFLTNKWIRGRKPLSLVSDVLFFILLLMLLVPATRSLLLTGAAAVRTWVTSPGGPAEKGTPLSDDSRSWILTDLQGREINFESLHGEVIFLNQWATWCPPCRAELSSVERLFHDYGTRMKMILLTGEDPQKVKKFVEKQGYTFPVYIGNAAGTSLAARTIPSTTIINRAGEMVVSRKGAYNWNARKVRRLIDRLIIN